MAKPQATLQTKTLRTLHQKMLLAIALTQVDDHAITQYLASLARALKNATDMSIPNAPKEPNGHAVSSFGEPTHGLVVGLLTTPSAE